MESHNKSGEWWTGSVEVSFENLSSFNWAFKVLQKAHWRFKLKWFTEKIRFEPILKDKTVKGFMCWEIINTKHLYHRLERGRKKFWLISGCERAFCDHWVIWWYSCSSVVFSWLAILISLEMGKLEAKCCCDGFGWFKALPIVWYYIYACIYFRTRFFEQMSYKIRLNTF